MEYSGANVCVHYMVDYSSLNFLERFTLYDGNIDLCCFVMLTKHFLLDISWNNLEGYFLESQYSTMNLVPLSWR